MNKKGFTLIELLAVIIILAIVALIATPIVLDVVDDARTSAARSEAAMIVKGINDGCATSAMKAQLTGNAADDKCAGKTSLTEAEIATMVDLGNAKNVTVTLSNGVVTAMSVESNTKTVKYDVAATTKYTVE